MAADSPTASPVVAQGGGGGSSGGGGSNSGTIIVIIVVVVVVVVVGACLFFALARGRKRSPEAFANPPPPPPSQRKDNVFSAEAPSIAMSELGAPLDDDDDEDADLLASVDSSTMEPALRKLVHQEEGILRDSDAAGLDILRGDR